MDGQVQLASLSSTESRHLSSELPNDSSPTQRLSISIEDNQINRLDYLISHLRTCRALLIQRKNTQHSAIFRLPSEVLAEIFAQTNAVERSSECSVDTTIRRHYPFTPVRLGAVCSRWRHVAWTSPRLWTKLSLSGCWIWEPRFPLVQILNIYYHNVKALKLSLSIDCFHDRFDFDGREDDLTGEDAFNTIFAKNTDKLRVLGLGAWPDDWSSRLEKIQETTVFSQLEEIWIKYPDDPFEEKFFLMNAPRLRKVVLSGVSEDAIIILPWTQITYLALSAFPSDLSLTIFTQCVNLEYFQCSELTPPRSGTITVRDDVNFPHLRTFFYLDCELSSSWRAAMIRNFRFPTLVSLTWCPDWSVAVERHVIRQYPGSIQFLEFQFPKKDQLSMKPMLLALNLLKELKIRCGPSIKSSVLDLLAPQKGRYFLPSLRRLYLTAESNEMTPKIVQSLLEMVKWRRTVTPAKLDHLILSYNVSSCELDPWPGPFVEGVKGFVSEGMKVVIEADDKDVDLDWLHAGR